MGLTAAAEWVVGQLLTRGSITAQAIATGATQNIDVDVAGEDQLDVLVDMTGAANGDLAVTVIPFQSDNITPIPNVNIQPIRSSGPTFGAGTVDFDGTWDVSGYSKVRIAIKNNNAAGQVINRASWRLS